MDIKHFLLGAAMSMTAVTPVVADELDLQNSTVLFREDFGGNSPSAPLYVSTDTLAGITTLKHQPNFPLATSSYRDYDSYDTGCYDIRKTGFHRSGSTDWYLDFDDHTSDTDPTRGYMMQCDAGTYATTFYTIQIDRLCSDTKLYLSMWGHPVNNSKDTNLKLIVEDLSGNTLSSESVVINHSLNEWQQVGTYFTTPQDETSVIYKIYAEGGNSGNDFALDDIEVRLCKPSVKVSSPSDTVCIGSSFTLTASYDNSDASYIEPLNYTWYENTINTYTLTGWTKVSSGSSLSVTNIASDTYYKVIVSSAGEAAEFNRCNSASENISVLVKQCNSSGCTPSSSTMADTICEGDSYQLGTETYTTEGTHTYLTQRIDGCDSIVTLNLTVLPTSSKTINAKVYYGEEYTENGFDLPAQTSVGTKRYRIKTVNQYGCDSIIRLNLSVVEQAIKIPTVFTPYHKDGKNDTFMRGYEVYIYDRYGNLICHSQNGWDGYYRGELADPGVYIYVLTTRGGSKKKGTIEVYK